MYAIAFDMVVSDLKEHYGESYTNAYNEIRNILANHDFYWIQGSTYASEENNLLTVTKAMTDLKSRQWFCLSVRDIRAFKIEDWSDFTSFFRE